MRVARSRRKRAVQWRRVGAAPLDRRPDGGTPARSRRPADPGGIEIYFTNVGIRLIAGRAYRRRHRGSRARRRDQRAWRGFLRRSQSDTVTSCSEDATSSRDDHRRLSVRAITACRRGGHARMIVPAADRWALAPATEVRRPVDPAEVGQRSIPRGGGLAVDRRCRSAASSRPDDADRQKVVLREHDRQAVGTLGIVAAVLASVGLWRATVVGRGAPAIGIRMAIGAFPRIVRMCLRETSDWWRSGIAIRFQSRYRVRLHISRCRPHAGATR